MVLIWYLPYINVNVTAMTGLSMTVTRFKMQTVLICRKSKSYTSLNVLAMSSKLNKGSVRYSIFPSELMRYCR